MKTLEGDQFHIKKPKIEPRSNIKLAWLERVMKAVVNIIKVEPPSKPSIPSAKLHKLVSDTNKKTNKNTIRNLKIKLKLWKFNEIRKGQFELNSNIKKELKIWKNSLFFAGIHLQSSMWPTNVMGIDKRGENSKYKRDPKIYIDEKINPPPIGVGILWELLLFGNTAHFFLKKGMQI